MVLVERRTGLLGFFAYLEDLAWVPLEGGLREGSVAIDGGRY